ncbi:MAG: GrpB family protein, partial [Chthoniobacterales bacterium]|nr:GrpB family protein [Chthoniobacterales bacterium]
MIDVRELERQAVNEPVSLAPYDPAWPRQFDVERARLAELAPEFLAIEHIGSTAIPGLAAKPIIDIIAAVPSMEVADVLVERLCANGYITSADFNRSLG